MVINFKFVTRVWRNRLNFDHVKDSLTHRLEWNVWHFTDDIFRCIWFRELCLFEISLKFVPIGFIRQWVNNISENGSATMAGRWTVAKPLHESRMVHFIGVYIRHPPSVCEATYVILQMCEKMTWLTYWSRKCLTRSGRVTYKCVSKLDHHWLR